MGDKPHTPAPVRLALEALDLLRKEDAEKAAAVAKLLPAFAIQLERRDGEVSVGALLEHARLGSEHILAQRGVGGSLTYAGIAARLKPCAAAVPEKAAVAKQWAEADNSGERPKMLRLNRRILKELNAGSDGTLRHRAEEFDSRDQLASVTAALLWVAEQGLEETVLLALKKGARIDGRAAARQDLLTQAAAHGNIDMCRLLLAYGAQINRQDSRGRTALAMAAKQGRLDMARFLLENGSRTSTSPKAEGTTTLLPLLLAVEAGNTDICRLLLDAGADVNARNDQKETALTRAARGGFTEICLLLLEHGAAPDRRDAGGWNALARAVQRFDAETCAVLLERGANPDGRRVDNGDRLLEFAAMNQSFDLCRLLLAAGASKRGLSKPARETLAQFTAATALWQEIVRQEPPADLLDCDPRLYHEKAFVAALKNCEAEGARRSDGSASFAFNAAALFGTEQRLLQYLDKWGEPSYRPFRDLAVGITVPPARKHAPKSKIDVKAWGDAALKCGPGLAALFEYADRLRQPSHSDDGRTWSLPKTREAIAPLAYKQGTRNPALAVLCLEHGISENDFKAALKLAKVAEKIGAGEKNIPDIVVQGGSFGLDGAVFHRLPAGDVRGLFLGELTDCCQSVGGSGAACARHGFLSKDSGFYVVEKDGQILGETWAWRGAKGELVFDSVETLGGRVTAKQWKDICDAFAKALAADPGDVTALHLGRGGGTPCSLADAFAKASSAKLRGYRGYSDAKEQVKVWERSASGTLFQTDPGSGFLSSSPSRPSIP